MIRRATPADIPALVDLVYDLAEYEKLREECVVTAEQLEQALFGPKPAVYAHVAENDQGIVGCAIWFLNYSTWKGVHGIFLEDLYVKPEARGHGLGRDLLAALARECVEQGYARFEWSVLTWNTPSIDFYESIGAVNQHEWTGYRLAGSALERLASHADD
ncbi:GNAT family N-acetyltransferase [Nocardia sp. ET3-3]|uniref:GNAT family N-acetyltransferase n=1 Tax=Nocardia terrae TaxID=2675851 RepID=A0A7K1V364_9NOCA|nr:GNAT family N-acetyltransferase [Nocardia terrae]MVU81080.1 GNAT family N-acetyltransferase [Nocardia terrae]